MIYNINMIHNVYKKHITNITISSNNRYIITSGYDKKIKIYDISDLS